MGIHLDIDLNLSCDICNEYPFPPNLNPPKPDSYASRLKLPDGFWDEPPPPAQGFGMGTLGDLIPDPHPTIAPVNGGWAFGIGGTW